MAPSGDHYIQVDHSSRGGKMGRVAFPFLLMFLVLMCPATVRADDAATCRTASGAEAIAACSRMIETGTYRGQAQAIIYNNRGKAFVEIGENDRALQDLNEAIQIDQNLAVPFSNRGMVWLNIKKYDPAIQDLNEATRLDPSLVAAYKNRAVVWLATKRYESAIADFDKVIQRNSPARC